MNIDDVIAHLLVAEGFVSVDDIALTPVSDLALIQGFDEDIATELQNRATEFVEAETSRITTALVELKVKDDLKEVDYLSLGMILTLAENEILCLMIWPNWTVRSWLDFSVSMALMMKQSLVILSWLLGTLVCR